MFWDSFKVTGSAMAQIFLLASIGYLVVKKNILGPEGLSSLSRLVIGITLPILIFCQLVKDFKFNLYPNWWVFPLLSIAITIVGLIAGILFMGLIKGSQNKLQFLSLVTFQNAGYLPLALAAALLPKENAEPMFIYIFMFLLGFNLLIWSVGVYMITFSQTKRFELGSLFSPPVIATIFTLIFISLGGDKFMPQALLRPLRMLGDSTFPLALFVIGGNLARIHPGQIDKKAIFLLVLAKLIVLPGLGILLILKLNLPAIIGLLLVMQLAMPPATSLSIIASHYKKKDLIISQGIFFGHILSLVTIPIFLSLYFIFSAIK